jgi:hypothetical protein
MPPPTFGMADISILLVDGTTMMASSGMISATGSSARLAVSDGSRPAGRRGESVPGGLRCANDRRGHELLHGVTRVFS